MTRAGQAPPGLNLCATHVYDTQENATKTAMSDLRVVCEVLYVLLVL